MKRYYLLNNDSRIVATTDLMFPQPNQDIFDFPSDFDFEKQGEYKITNGELLHEPLPQEPITHIPSIEERTAASEAAIKAIMGEKKNV